MTPGHDGAPQLAAVGDERRIARDGHTYTHAEFLAHYDWLLVKEKSYTVLRVFHFF